MCSEKIVCYPEYRLLGERVSGCGYLKMQVQGDELCFDMKLKGLWDEPLLTKPVYIYSGGKDRKVGTIVIENGKGAFTRIYRGEQLHGEEAVAVLTWEGIRIPLDERREIVCERELPEQMTNAELTSTESAGVPIHTPVNYAEAEQENTEQKNTEQKNTEQKNAEQKNVEQPQSVATNENSGTPGNANIPAFKWEYLTKIYPHKRPFRDAREFLSIGPGDFAVLSERSYKLANNSFTLHGYYNFGHLLLARMPKEQGFRYYVGVPGYYFDKEKQAAMLFGFESFEGVKDPAAQGDFGYYLLAVEL